MSAERLQQLLDSTDADSREWFQRALDRRGDEGLERALEIAGQRAADEYRETLRTVAALLDPEDRMRPWPLAERVAKALTWYETRRSGRTPESELDRTLWRATLLEQSECVRPIRSQRGIYNLLNEPG